MRAVAVFATLMLMGSSIAAPARPTGECLEQNLLTSMSAFPKNSFISSSIPAVIDSSSTQVI